MKIRKHLYVTETTPVQKVFRVDDEIEVVVQDVDLNVKSRALKKELRESIEQVWHRNPEWLGALKPLVLGGLSSCLTTNGRGTDYPYRNKHVSLSSKKKSCTRANSVCVTPSISIVKKQVNGETHVVSCFTDMTDLTPKTEMTPPNDMIVVSSDNEESSREIAESSPTTSINGRTQSPPIAKVVVGDSPCGDSTSSSVIEIKIENNVPVIDIDDPVHMNGTVKLMCNGDLADHSSNLEFTSKDAPELPDRPVQVKGENKPDHQNVKKKYKSELDRLYVSLKEIPWAQNWSPKTFLSRNTKSTFPKRYTARIKKDDISKSIKKKPTFVISRNQTLPKGKVKGLVTSMKSKVKTKSKPLTNNGLAEKRPSPKEQVKKRKANAMLFDGNTSHPKNGFMNSGVKVSEKELSTSSTTSVMTCKAGAGQKLSTNLAIKRYDASKMCKSRTSPKRKFGVHYELPNCPVPLKQGPLVPGVTNKVTLGKLNASYSKVSPSLSSSAQGGISVPHRKDQTKPNSCLEDSKPLAAVSPKLLTFSAATDCNGFPAVKAEGAGHTSCAGVGGSSSESRLGNEQLLQRQLVSVLGKEPLEAKKRKLEDESLRYSVRQSECAFRYKEIAVKKHSNYIQIILVPNRTRHNGLTLEALQELREALVSAKKDPTCKVLLLNSSGSIFCSGIDLASLVGQLHMPHKISQAVRSLIETLALFSKPVVAAVNGAAVGLGVTLLTYCDVVFASEKATFFTPYARLGHIPEGAMTLVLPQVVGSLVASDMLLRDRKLTAFQASIYGLVSEVIWPSQFMESVIPRVQAMANQSGQAMESTKVLLRYHQWDKLQSTLENESRLLPKQWLSQSCQKALKQALDQPGGLIDW